MKRVLGYRKATSIIVLYNLKRQIPWTNTAYLILAIWIISFSDVVQEIVNNLKEYYLNSYCKKLVYPWKQGEYVDLDRIYIPVTIDIKLPGVRPIKQRVEEYQDLFEDSQYGTRLVLTGNPGQGKSSFCAKLAYDWCHGTLQNIRLLFVLQLGLMDHKNSIEDEICSQLLSTDIDSSFLLKIIRAMGNTILLVFDGMDEARPDLMQQQSVGNLLNIIKYKDLRSCRVLITTRPWRENEITQFPVYKRLELQRMTKTDVKAYVNKIFGQNKTDYIPLALGQQLLKVIEENRLLVDTSTPLIVLLICWYWAETEGKQGIPDRIGQLYSNIVTIMYGRIPHPTVEKVNTYTTDRNWISGLKSKCFPFKSET